MGLLFRVLGFSRIESFSPKDSGPIFSMIIEVVSVEGVVLFDTRIWWFGVISMVQLYKRPKLRVRRNTTLAFWQRNGLRRYRLESVM